MSRPKRILRKKFIVFCEGDTEYNYVDGMRLKQGVELALKPINMQGGGYKSFLDEIKKEASNNWLAKFISIDFDRTKKHSGELEKLKEIIKYCELQNGSGRIPCFLILDNPDFEYVACLHAEDYNGQETKKYIEQILGFDSLEKFKKKKDIYCYLNTNHNSYDRMLARLGEKVIINHYQIKKANFDIKITDTEVIWDNGNKRGSNINEFFDIIDW